MAFGTDFPEAYRNIHEEWVEVQTRTLNDEYDMEYYVPSGKYAKLQVVV